MDQSVGWMVSGGCLLNNSISAQECKDVFNKIHKRNNRAKTISNEKLSWRKIIFAIDKVKEVWKSFTVRQRPF